MPLILQAGINNRRPLVISTFSHFSDNGTNKLCLDIPRHQPFVVHLQQININMTLQQNQSETEKDSTNSRASGCLDTFTRLKLLLNVRQMIEEAYPVPFLEGNALILPWLLA